MPNLQGDALNCGDVGGSVTVLVVGVDPYGLDGDSDGVGCEAPRETDPGPTDPPEPGEDCHPAYQPCLPNLQGDALSCGDVDGPITVRVIGVDPYRLDGDSDGFGCTS